MREYKNCYVDYCKWLVKKTGDKNYSYENMLEHSDVNNVHSFLYKSILELCYDPKDGLYFFTKFIIGDLLDIGYPSKFRYNTLLRTWDKLVKENKKLAIMCARGHGKEIADSVPTLTTDGWKTHGELVCGDEVYHPSGKPTKVLDISKKHVDDYVVNTKNKESIRCHANHEWTVFDAKSRKMVTVETKEMVNNTKWLGNRSRYLLPNISPLEFEPKKLPIDAYFLGLWLGDGTSCKPCISHNKDDTESIKSLPYKISSVYEHKKTGVLTTVFYKNGIIENIRKLNLFKNKHIPTIYLNSSIKQRLEMLAGIIDSDGCVSKKNNDIRIVNTNKKIIDGCKDLLISLGLRPNISIQYPNHKNHKYGIYGKLPVYTIKFVTNLNIPTRLPRKKVKLTKLNRISINSVRYEPNGEMGNCIMVDSDDGLYLVGKKLIPTHNSVFFTQMLLIYDMFLFKHRRMIVISASQEQANRLLDEVKTIIDNNEWLKTKKNENRWAKETIGYNKGYVLVAGVGAEILGQHVDRIICDDILRSDNKLSDDQIEDYIDMNLDPMLLNRNGQMILVGTPKRESDVFAVIFKRKKEDPRCPWYIERFPAVIDYEKKLIQCPDRFTWNNLMDKRLSMGPLKFAREYQLEFFSRDTSLFPKNIIKPAKDKGIEMCLMPIADKRTPNWMFFAGVDVARSGSVSADYTVCVVVAYDSINQEKHIVHFWREKGLKISEQSRKMAEISKKFNNCMVCVETNNMGQEMVDRLVDDYNIYVEPITVGGHAKREELVRFLITSFENEKIIIPRGDAETRYQMDILENELAKYCVTITPAGNERFEGVGSHDDAVDALSLANKATQIGGVPFAVSSYKSERISTDPYATFTQRANKGESDLVNKIKMGLIK